MALAGDNIRANTPARGTGFLTYEYRLCPLKMRDMVQNELIISVNSLLANVGAGGFNPAIDMITSSIDKTSAGREEGSKAAV
jgi:hypothetical protein